MVHNRVVKCAFRYPPFADALSPASSLRKCSPTGAVVAAATCLRKVHSQILPQSLFLRTAAWAAERLCPTTPHAGAGIRALKHERDLAIIMVIRITFHSKPIQQKPRRCRGAVGFVKSYLETFGTLWWIDVEPRRLSRNAISCQVSHLRRKGWRIENIRDKGYRLIARPQSTHPPDTPPPPQPKHAARPHTHFVRRLLLLHGHLWPQEVANDTITRHQLRQQVYWLRRRGWQIETTARGWVLRSPPPSRPAATRRPAFVEKHLQRRGFLWWTDALRAGVTRHVVHNQVQRLRRKGWRIEASPRGFRLRGIPAPSHPRATPKSLTRLSAVKRRR